MQKDVQLSSAVCTDAIFDHLLWDFSAKQQAVVRFLP
jgi:hypothetical protein